MMALLKKEWREHRLAIVLLYLVGLFMLAVASKQAEDAITPLAAWHLLVVQFGSMAAVFITNRLVVREYGRGTQLFLETLPVSRATVLLTKWMIGWFWLLLIMALAFSLILWKAQDQVSLTASFIAMMALRASAFLLFVYATAFAVALTLRLRFFIWALLLIAAVIMNEQMQLPIGEWAPFYLVKVTMVLERSRFPWWELGLTTALALAMLGISTVIAVLVRGALVTALARRLSARTRTGLALAFGLAIWLSMLLDKRVEPPAFKMQRAAASTTRPAVYIGSKQTVGGRPPAQAATRISQDLARMQAWLGLGTLSATSLAADAWLQPHQFSAAQGSPGHLVLRAALGHPDLSAGDLEAAVRAMHIGDQGPMYRWREDRTWLLAGFAYWWGAQQDEHMRALLERRVHAASSWLRVHGMDLGTALRSSAATSERLGECLGDALAWRAVQTLSEQLGKERFQALMRGALGLPLPDKLNQIAGARSTEALLADAGLPLPQLARILGQAPGSATAQAAAPSLRVDAAPIAGNLVELRYRLANRPPAQDVAIHYRSLLPAESQVDSSGTRVISAQDAGVLPSTFVRGRHVLVYAETRDPDLACNVRFGAVRKELP